MNAELINTGTELLLGSVLNSHLTWLGRELFGLGFRITRQLAIPDGAIIRTALEESFARRPDLVLVTGGLGPTTDDITRDLLAEMLGVPLVEDARILSMIAERFARRNLQPSERVRLQALVPQGVQPLLNQWGTAPGLLLPASEKNPPVFFLPGPPRELRPMFSEVVVPLLRELFPEREKLQSRVFRVAGIGESAVEARVGESLLRLPDLELGYCARPGEVDVRVIGPTATLDQAEQIIRAAFSAHIYAQDDGTMESTLVRLLRERKFTVATAESCTGGLLAHRLTNVPGSSEVFLQGMVTYANMAKLSALQIDSELLDQHGAVSEAVAIAMASNVRWLAGSDFALSTTGIAGPGGGSEEKPVGTVYIGLASAAGASATRHFFPTERETFKMMTSQAAFEKLRQALAEPESP